MTQTSLQDKGQFVKLSGAQYLQIYDESGRLVLVEIFDIYRLTDPRDSSTHYVGISTNVTYRYKQHIKRLHCNPQKVAWIRELQDQGLQPQLDIIERVIGRKPAKERERYWIHFFGKQGSPLTNIQGNPYEMEVSA